MCERFLLQLGGAIAASKANFFLLNIHFARGLISFFIGELLGSSKVRGWIEGLRGYRRLLFRVGLIALLVWFVRVHILDAEQFVTDVLDFGVVIPYGFIFFPALLLLLYDVTWLNRLLDNRAVRFLGKISYGIYIWNFPLIITECYLVRLEVIEAEWLDSYAGVFCNLLLHILVGSLSYLAGTWIKAHRWKLRFLGDRSR